jgi:hypothetical protein
VTAVLLAPLLAAALTAGPLATTAQGAEPGERCGRAQDSVLAGTRPEVRAALVVCALPAAEGVLRVTSTVTLTARAPAPAGLLDRAVIHVSVQPAAGPPLRRRCDFLPQVGGGWTSRALRCVVRATATGGQFTPTARFLYAVAPAPPTAPAGRQGATAAPAQGVAARAAPGRTAEAGARGEQGAADDAPAAERPPVAGLVLLAVAAGLAAAVLDRVRGARSRRRARS